MLSCRRFVLNLYCQSLLYNNQNDQSKEIIPQLWPFWRIKVIGVTFVFSWGTFCLPAFLLHIK